MSTLDQRLQAGTQALNERRYADAVRDLEQFCQHYPHRGSRTYFQARMWLIKAYKKNGQDERAIALCQQLAACPIPAVQTWALQTLPRLQPAGETPATVADAPGSSREHLQVGSAALKQQNYSVAVSELAAFLQQAPLSHPDREQAQIWLAQAYKGDGQKDRARELGRQLADSDSSLTRLWAQQFLPQLGSPPLPPLAEPPEPPEPPPPPQADATPAPLGADRGSRQMLSILCHAAPYISWVVPLASVVIPLVVLLSAQDRVVKQNAAEALNYALSVLLYGVLAFVVLGLLALILGDPRALTFPIFWVLALAVVSLILPLLAIIHCARQPDRPYRYPLIVHFC